MPAVNPPYECDVCGAVWATPRGFASHFKRVAHSYADHSEGGEA